MIEKYLNEIDVGEITKRLISIPSYSALPNQEQAISEMIAAMFREEGIDVTLQEVWPGRPNVIARIPGKGGPSLMLCGHLDTVPAYDMENAFIPIVRDGVLHGRGACDMKGAVAAMITAMIAIKRSGAALKGDLIFSGLVDEEEGGIGAEYLVGYGPRADAAIIGEPTDLQIALGHKGLEWISIDVEGKKVHGGNQALGVNAVEMAARLIKRICTDYTDILRSRTHPVLGSASINVGRIEGGDQPSTVPDACRLLLDRRMILGETRDQVYDELAELCAQLHHEDNAFRAHVSDLMEGRTQKYHLPFCVSEKEPVAQSLAAALQKMGKEVVYTAFPAWSDAGTLKAYSDCVPIVCGPGQLKNAHSIHDSIKLTELQEAAHVYALTAVNYLIGKGAF